MKTLNTNMYDYHTDCINPLYHDVLSFLFPDWIILMHILAVKISL